jgi:hypothetical protein
MKIPHPSWSPLALAISALSLAALPLTVLAQIAPTANDESDLPQTLRSGYVDPIKGPADSRACARGTRGLIRPSFGRASLFVAWRVMHLPVGAVAHENHRRQGDWLRGVATPGHPMRGWASLGALRCVLRDAVRDTAWEAAVDDAWTKRKLRGAAFNTAMAEPAARHRARVQTALQDFERRAQAALADTGIAPVHPTINYTWRRAMLQLTPMMPLGMAINALNTPETNPYTMVALDLVQELFPRVAPERPEGPLGVAMRKHPWLDFVITVQACTDLPQKMDAAICDTEHAHAQARWQETQDKAWLLAVLMTARQPTAADLPAALAAIALPADRPEWASLQFYAARVLRAQGRSTEARAGFDALARSPVIHKRDREWLEAQRCGL